LVSLFVVVYANNSSGVAHMNQGQLNVIIIVGVFVVVAGHQAGCWCCFPGTKATGIRYFLGLAWYPEEIIARTDCT